jgi:hypothetical protein
MYLLGFAIGTTCGMASDLASGKASGKKEGKKDIKKKIRQLTEINTISIRDKDGRVLSYDEFETFLD